jgi:hypothetical protein
MQALEAARAIAAETGAKVEPVLVLPLQTIPYGEAIQHRWSEVAKQMNPEDLARLGGVDDLDGQVSYGSPGKALAGFGDEVYLLIVGSRSCRSVAYSPGAHPTISRATRIAPYSCALVAWTNWGYRVRLRRDDLGVDELVIERVADELGSRH